VTPNVHGRSDPHRIRILVVDDSAPIRRMVAEFLSGEADLEVVCTAENGRVALKAILLLEPDVVIMDIVMPVLDGWESLKAIRLSHEHMPVIMFSSLAQDVDVARLAEELGATACVPKPTRMEDRDGALQHLREHLLVTVRSMAARRRAAVP
jgi:two-component system chemotaxis response regulator CheB